MNLMPYKDFFLATHVLSIFTCPIGLTLFLGASAAKMGVLC